MKYSLSAWLRAGILLFGAAIPLAAGALLWRAAERAAASERELVLQHTAESAQAALRAEADRLAARVGGAVARAELVVAAGGTGAGLDSLLRATRDEILPRPSDGALAVFDPRGLPVAVTSPALGLLGPPPRGLIRQAIETGSATDCLEESGRPVLALAASLRRGGEVTGVLVLTHLIEAAGVGARAQVKVLWAGRALPEADSLESRISMGLRHAGAEASRAPRVRFRVSAPGPAGYEVLALPAFPGATGAVPYVAAALPHSPLGAAGSLPAAAAALLVLGACGGGGRRRSPRRRRRAPRAARCWTLTTPPGSARSSSRPASPSWSSTRGCGCSTPTRTPRRSPASAWRSSRGST
ncbi:MAG: hypothetical protein HZB25_10055 [Candidatus Eisenbacteria bacterium]|nr:hypothetical protein [Candidatus Eisenbacteria bacterium]